LVKNISILESHKLLVYNSDIWLKYNNNLAIKSAV